MNGLMMHTPTGGLATLDQIAAVPTPMHTETWRPVRYMDAIDFVKEKAVAVLGAEIEDEQYGLARNGNQMFGVLTLGSDAGDHGLSIGLRGSYDKSLSNGVAIGAQVFVCDNLCFSGSAVKILRRNTINVWNDFTRMVEGHMKKAIGHYQDVTADIEKLKSAGCTQDRGYEVLGLMQGHNLLKPRQASIALGDWQEPRHEEFAERTLWSLYNCATEGMKKGSPANLIERHTDAHEFVMGLVA